MTGISIGCAAIIVAISIGNGAQSYLETEIIGGMKLDEITVTPQSTGGPGEGGGQSAGGERGLLTDDKVQVIQGFNHVKSVVATKQLGYFRTISSDNLIHEGINIVAVDLSKLQEQGNRFKEGGPLEQIGAVVLNYGATTGWKDAETSERLNNMMNSDPNNPQLWEEFQKYESTVSEMIGKNVQLEQMDNDKKLLSPQLYVGGVLDVPKGRDAQFAFYDRQAYISFDTAEWLTDSLNLQKGPATKQRVYDNLTVKVEDLQYIKPLEDLISKLALNASDNLAMRDQVASQLDTFKAIALGVGVFILLLASISIIVAMTMSTHQRRRQIGIMKVLGANMPQIRNMFIVEASLLGLLGGLLGIVFAYLIIKGLNSFIMASAGMSGLQIAVTPETLPIGIAFAVMTGIFSGIYPAISAARTNALLAIKRD
ncbi:MAG: ABC transporter permease [Paenibacillus lautus]|jgi:ABC-type lipoprotein release transport system permease subunit|nr:ABC transporter permease [Paenibacillus lautus]MCI1772502.1 ABC transporter permease [Paenibacillus lautus]VTR61956.1 macrolide-specific ABC-type efflux carrier [Actinobacillus pleuropneumoniae]